MIARGFKAILSCVEGKVGPGFVGRAYDDRLLDDLPAGIDPCGEYGEFHSFVYDSPGFRLARRGGRSVKPSSATGDITRTCCSRDRPRWRLVARPASRRSERAD